MVPILGGVVADRAVPEATKARQKIQEMQRDKRISGTLGPFETEFSDAIKERMHERADDNENYHLKTFATNWGAIADEIDAYELVYEKESEAIDRTSSSSSSTRSTTPCVMAAGGTSIRN